MAKLDDSIHVIRGIYIGLSYKPPHNQHTILAAFFLSSQNWPTCKVISLATGTKCLPTTRFPKGGEALHDCHAEIVARRAALRWFLEEIVRHQNSQQSPWICCAPESGKYHLRAGVQLNLYISTLPCGDASTRYLAATQSEEMAQLKDWSSPPPVVLSDSPMPHFMASPGVISRGRDGYSRLGVLRTKPGRADSPPTTCMSCSDKIAAWNVCGIQGALGSHILQPIYIDAVFLGEVPNDDNLWHTVYEDCERALWDRVANVRDLPCGYAVHKPVIRFTNLPFIHSRVELAKIASDTSPTNECCVMLDR
ncbi:hypothetical protein APHAL10511_002022 [Amanita phalloides]|nr:hypothetical protein APHAL10511_002022 [Amanita phalloides]